MGLSPSSSQGTAPASGRCPAASAPQPDNAGQTPFTSLLPSHRGAGGNTQATDGGSQQHTQTACKHQGCANLCHPLALQTGTQFTTAAGARVQEHYCKMNMDKLMEGILLTHTHHHHIARTKHMPILFLRVKRTHFVFPKRAAP